MDSEAFRKIAASANMPAVAKLQRLNAELEQSHIDMQRIIARTNEAKEQRRQLDDQRTERMLELTEATAMATAELALLAAAQHQESRRLGLLTWVLSAAVIFEIVQASFDDHSPRTAITAAAIAGLVVILARGIGKLVLRIRSRKG